MLVNKSVLINNEIYVPLNRMTTFKLIDNSKSFDDVKNHLNKNSIDFVTSHELFKGTSENNMTHGMLVTILYRLENTPKPMTEQSFNDVADTAYYSNAVKWASENNIVNAFKNNFSPDENIIREQFAVIMYNYAKSIKLDINDKGNISNFSDSSDVSVWAIEAMEYALGSGLILENNDKNLNSKSTVIRAEAAYIINKFVENIALN